MRISRRYRSYYHWLSPLVKNANGRNYFSLSYWAVPIWWWVVLCGYVEKFPWVRYLDSWNTYMKQKTHIRELPPRTPMVATIGQKSGCHEFIPCSYIYEGQPPYDLWRSKKNSPERAFTIHRTYIWNIMRISWSYTLGHQWLPPLVKSPCVKNLSQPSIWLSPYAGWGSRKIPLSALFGFMEHI